MPDPKLLEPATPKPHDPTIRAIVARETGQRLVRVIDCTGCRPLIGQTRARMVASVVETIQSGRTASFRTREEIVERTSLNGAT